MTNAPEEPQLSAEDLEYADPYDGMDFQPYDPAEASQLPLGTPLGAGKDSENDEPGPFNPKYKEDFEGLAFLGALEARFSFIGHKFHIRTLATHELLAVGQIIKAYDGTIGQTKAYATAMIALSVVSVDGVGLPIPIGESKNDLDWAFQRFDYVAAKWFPFTVDYVYERYLLLENRVQDVLIEMAEQAKKAERRAGSIPG